MSALVNTFIPHRKNNYRPHLIQKHGLLVSVLLILVIQVAYNFQNSGTFQVLGYATNINSSALLSLTNQNRQAGGLGALTSNGKLASAAQSKAQHMINNDYWAHVAPDGTTPWVFIGNAGYSYVKAGENLAAGYATSEDTVQAWMNSPSHRDNIMTAQYKDVGFGIANGANFQGSNSTVVVAMYGNPTPVAPTVTEAATEAPTPQQSRASAAAPAVEAVVEQPAEVAATEPQVAEEEPQLPAVNIPQINGFGTLSSASTATSNFQALLNGSASWALYLTSLILVAIGSIYTYRHVLFIQTIIVRGEHVMHAHPLLEASMIYATIWIVLSAQYGVIR